MITHFQKFGCISTLSQKCKPLERISNLDRESLAYLKWQLWHSPKCKINHQGLSGSMEVEGLREIFQRSESKCSVRYTTVVGDGDSASHSRSTAEKPYGPDIIIEKRSALVKYKKRLGTKFRKLKSRLGDKKVEGWKRTWGYRQVNKKND